MDPSSLLRSTLPASLVEPTLRWLEEPLHHVVARNDPAYPRMLAQIPDPPPLLYVQGRVELLNRPAFAIVGSRNASTQGVRDAEAFACALSEAGLCVVSGLALGIDAAAHRGGLRAAGSSIAVIGTGSDRVYPARNSDLSRDLAQHGAIVSEFPLETPPRPENFPRRNRLISGLSKGVLVVEAALGSGSLITAKLANDQNRDVFALPGSIHSPLSRGCHALIREGAKLVECVEHILEELKIDHEPAAPQQVPPAYADEFLDVMGDTPLSIDQIAQRTGASAEAIAARLSLLQIEGRIATMPGGFFQPLRGSIE